MRRPVTRTAGQNDRVEEALLGGNLSASVRIGDTVHRRAGPWTPAVHALLAYLHRVGFGLVPEPLGMDEQGRAVLLFIPGEVHGGWPDPLPSWMFEDQVTLTAAAKLLRRYHDVLEGFVPPPDGRWRSVAPGAHEVVCHNDWSPTPSSEATRRSACSTGTRRVRGAGPGISPGPLTGGCRSIRGSRRRASRTRPRASRCSATPYGEGIERQDVFDTLTEQLLVDADFCQTEADAGDPGYAKLAGWNIPAVLRQDSDDLIRQRDVLRG